MSGSRRSGCRPLDGHRRTLPTRSCDDWRPTVSDPTRIRVGQGSDSAYDVVIGSGLLSQLPGLLGSGVERVLVIHPRALRATGETVRDDLGAQGFSAFLAEVPDAEEAKSAEVAASLWGVLGQSGFTRSD